MNSCRVLFIGGGPMMPTSQPMEALKFECFSRYFSGDIITGIMSSKHTNIKSFGNFQYYPFVISGNTVAKNSKLIFFYIKKAMELYRKQGKYDVIIASNPLLSGMIALLIGRIIGAKVVIEVNGNFESAFKYGGKKKGGRHLLESLKELYSRIIIPFILKRADMVKLLADNQIEPFRLDPKKMRVRVISEFVPIQKFMEHPTNDFKYILLLGYPWYLKGVDILIKAFNKISSVFPEYKLKIIGWCPEGRDYFIKLTENNHKIELCESVYYHEVIPIMASCSLYVLASRTEAMGRVLIEAMACKKPIVASNVGGVYSIVKDGFNGLLFKKENVCELAEKMRYLLSHPDAADRLASNGFHYAQKYLSEECYINNYRKLIYETIRISQQ